jgi:hypothetical protein
MHNNVVTPIMNFNLKVLFFLYFHELTNSKLNQFLSISKEAIFRVLHRGTLPGVRPYGPLIRGPAAERWGGALVAGAQGGCQNSRWRRGRQIATTRGPGMQGRRRGGGRLWRWCGWCPQPVLRVAAIGDGMGSGRSRERHRERRR